MATTVCQLDDRLNSFSSRTLEVENAVTTQIATLEDQNRTQSNQLTELMARSEGHSLQFATLTTRLEGMEDRAATRFAQFDQLQQNVQEILRRLEVQQRPEVQQAERQEDRGLLPLPNSRFRIPDPAIQMNRGPLPPPQKLGSFHLRSQKPVKYYQRYDPFLQSIGFASIPDISKIKLDGALINALVERWRPETSTFHLFTGECTITLQDVELLLVQTDFLGNKLRTSWLRHQFNSLPNNASIQDLQNFANTYILSLIGGVLFPNRSGGNVSCSFLWILRDWDKATSYSWGSAVLSNTYREMGRTVFGYGSTGGSTHGDLAGCFILLQLWAWQRLPSIATIPREPDVHHVPFGLRWIDLENNEASLELMEYRVFFDTTKEFELDVMEVAREKTRPGLVLGDSEVQHLDALLKTSMLIGGGDIREIGDSVIDGAPSEEAYVHYPQYMPRKQWKRRDRARGRGRENVESVSNPIQEQDRQFPHIPNPLEVRLPYHGGSVNQGEGVTPGPSSQFGTPIYAATYDTMHYESGGSGLGFAKFGTTDTSRGFGGINTPTSQQLSQQEALRQSSTVDFDDDDVMPVPVLPRGRGRGRTRDPGENVEGHHQYGLRDRATIPPTLCRTGGRHPLRDGHH
ncbi:unnamed protein product [Linum tenue]|uniref:Aminotransferase-like plant mobile domain-containing protein n=1 Tax=Linum tenue TaxID=586396 RepID=A0AAV0P0H4_9ROSI|nr:unnamed protein product [Linum tenue]